MITFMHSVKWVLEYEVQRVEAVAPRRNHQRPLTLFLQVLDMSSKRVIVTTCSRNSDWATSALVLMSRLLTLNRNLHRRTLAIRSKLVPVVSLIAFAPNWATTFALSTEAQPAFLK